jgi:hypothetical protein
MKLINYTTVLLLNEKNMKFGFGYITLSYKPEYKIVRFTYASSSCGYEIDYYYIHITTPNTIIYYF